MAADFFCPSFLPVVGCFIHPLSTVWPPPLSVHLSGYPTIIFGCPTSLRGRLSRVSRLFSLCWLYGCCHHRLGFSFFFSYSSPLPSSPAPFPLLLLSSFSVIIVVSIVFLSVSVVFRTTRMLLPCRIRRLPLVHHHHHFSHIYAKNKPNKTHIKTLVCGKIVRAIKLPFPASLAHHILLLLAHCCFNFSHHPFVHILLPSFVAHRRFDFSHIIAAAYPSSTSFAKGDSPLWSPKGVIGFRVRVKDNDDDDE